MVCCAAAMAVMAGVVGLGRALLALVGRRLDPAASEATFAPPATYRPATSRPGPTPDGGSR